MFDFYARVRPSRIFNMKIEDKFTHRNLRWGKPTNKYYNMVP